MKIILKKSIYQGFRNYERTIRYSSETPITIWKADNAHEHVGLCFVMAQLKDKKSIRVMNTSEASKEILKLEYVIRGTGELPPESLALIQKVL